MRARLGVLLTLGLGLGLLRCSDGAGGKAASHGEGGSSVAGGSGSLGFAGAAGEAGDGTTGGGAGSGSTSAAGAGGAGGASTSATSDSGGVGGGGNGSSVGGGGAATSDDATAGLAGQGGEGPEGPLLTDLLIEGGRLAQLPEFAPDRQRYSVIATDNPNTLVVTATAEASLTLTVSGRPAKSGEPVELADLKPNSEFDVRVTDDLGASRSYTVLLLPQSFPEFRVTVREPGASAAPIYLTPNSKTSRYIVKLDNYGVPLFYGRPSAQAKDFKRHWNGVMSYYARDEHILLDVDFKEFARVRAAGDLATNQHEFRILSNGNYAILANARTARDLTSLGGAAEEEVVDNVLQEVTPAGELLFEWNSWDHFDWDREVWPENADYAHLNTIDFDADGDWLISLRRPSQIVKIDRETGEVVWRLGGVSSDFEFVNDPVGGLCGQHSASVLDNGNILVFDNGFGCSGFPLQDEHTRVVEYQLDPVAMTAELVWSYAPTGTRSQSMGSAQRLPNGNTFVGWGMSYNPVLATEVDPDGNVVFQLEGYSVDSEPPASYRTLRFADD